MRTSALVLYAFLASIILSLSPAFSQITSVPIQSAMNSHSSDGFTYALPLNVIKVDVHITKTDKYKGKYSDYASRFLGITDIITRDNSTYSLQKVTLSTISEVDSSHVYFASLPEKIDEKRRIMIQLTDNGLITGFYNMKKEVTDESTTSASRSPFRDLLKPVLIERVDTIIRRVSIDTNIIEEKVLKRSISEKSNEQQAREIADLIYRIEDNKFSLITGYQEVNYSKESLQFMLDKLNSMEKEYLAFFKGSTIKSEQVYTFYYAPSETVNETMATLFRFSETEGIAGKNSSTGEAVNIIVNSLNQLTDVKAFETRRLNARKKSHGIFYRVPGKVQVQVVNGSRVLATAKTYISQLGILTYLPAKNMSSFEFHENGSLKSLILE